MANYYVHPLAGKSTNNGTSWTTPLATLTQALVKATVGTDVIHLAPGVYFGGDYYMYDSPSNLTIKGYGAIMNCAGYNYFLKSTRGNRYCYLDGLTITGYSTCLHNQASYPGAHIHYHGCTIYQKGLLKDITYIANGYAKAPRFYGCTLWGIRYSYAGDGDIGEYGYIYDCILQIPYWNIYLNRVYLHNNACSASATSLKGASGWETATYPIPVYDEDSDAPDLRFDPNHVQFAKYATGSYRGGIVGHHAGPSVSFTRHMTRLALDTNLVHGPWTQDESYYDTSFPEVIVSAGANKYIDFDEGGVELNGSVADNTYTTKATLVAAVAVAMNTAATATISCNVADSLRSTIATDGATLNLLPNSGTNAANSIYEELGFNTASDYSGQVLYTSDDPMVGGPVGAAPADAAPAKIADDKITIDFDIEPNGISARSISPVIELSEPAKLKRIYLDRAIEDLGAIDNSALDAAREIEVRASNTLFDKDDAAGTTTLDWTMIEYDGLKDLDETYRCWQIRLIVRLDKVS